MQIKEWITSWKLDDTRVRILWRILHASLIKTGEMCAEFKQGMSFFIVFHSKLISSTGLRRRKWWWNCWRPSRRTLPVKPRRKPSSTLSVHFSYLVHGYFSFSTIFCWNRCVRDAIGDPYAVSLDHLLHLKPVQHLKGQPIFQVKKNEERRLCIDRLWFYS